MLSQKERRLLLACQGGLPLSPTPYAELAARLDMDETEVLSIFRRWQASGLLRRVALVPNHYRLGYRHNLMTVWDLADEIVDVIGERFAASGLVSHCYRRPRRLPAWPYNLFAMVHGRSQQQVEDKVAHLKTLADNQWRAFDCLPSCRILKKTGLRLSAEGER